MATNYHSDDHVTHPDYQKSIGVILPTDVFMIMPTVGNLSSRVNGSKEIPHSIAFNAYSQGILLSDDFSKGTHQAIRGLSISDDKEDINGLINGDVEMKKQVQERLQELALFHLSLQDGLDVSAPQPTSREAAQERATIINMESRIASQNGETFIPNMKDHLQTIDPSRKEPDNMYFEM